MGRESFIKGKQFEDECKSVLQSLGFADREVKQVESLGAREYAKKQIRVQGRRCTWKNDITVRFANGGNGVIECKNPDAKNSANVNISVWEVIAKFLDLRGAGYTPIAVWPDSGLDKAKKGVREIMEQDLGIHILSPSKLKTFLKEQGLA